VAEWEKDGRFPRETIDRLAGMGVLGMMIPEEYGGAGADALSYVLVIEELARADASIAVVVSVNNSVACYPIWKFGNEAQKTTVLKDLASGKALGAYALTEPQSGSDAANQKTRAVRDGDCYVLNGAKAWITNAGEAKWYVVMAMTDPERGTHGITAFLVSADDPGVRVGAPEDKMGLRSSKTASLFLEDVRVPADRRLGAEGQGFTIAMTTLDHSRIGIAAQGIGIAQAAYEASVEYGKTRETFGKKLAEHEAIAFQIADMRVQLEASRALTYRAALLSERPGVRFSKESSMAKVYATEACNAIAARAVQIFGGYGYSREYPVERYYRDARVTTIYEGTSEIQRIVISKNVLAGR
jgi:alkylation response protein AidB-like acyl-CoA dehydrogenase